MLIANHEILYFYIYFYKACIFREVSVMKFLSMCLTIEFVVYFKEACYRDKFIPTNVFSRVIFKTLL